MTIAQVLNDYEITEHVQNILRGHFGHLGFMRAEAISTTSFEGDPVIKVEARYKDKDVSSLLLSSAHVLMNHLRDLGEDRFVFVENIYDNDELSDEDETE